MDDHTYTQNTHKKKNDDNDMAMAKHKLYKK